MTVRLSFLMFKILSVFLIAAMFPLNAIAANGGYPYASYAGPGTSPKDSIWTDARGNSFSPYGYVFRNCTDFAAWKVTSLGGGQYKVKGLGNGAQWAERAKARGLKVSASPGVWTVGVSQKGGYGHVAFVEEVKTNGVITVSEYNVASPGSYGMRTGTPTALGLSQFISLGLSPPEASVWKPSVQVTRIKKTHSSDVHLLYSATRDTVYETWWRSGQAIHTAPIISVPGITDIAKRERSDGTHLLYTATPNGVYESWWRPGEGVHSAKIISLNGVSRIITEQQPDGTHSLYALTKDGPYEFWWRDGGNIQGFRLAHIIDPVAMVKAYGPDGRHQIITATAGAVFESAWLPGQGVQTRQLIGIAQTDIVDVAKQTLPDGTELLYTAVSTGVWESWWRPGMQPSHSKIVGTPAVQQIEKQVTSDGAHVLYVAGEQEVKEYCWYPGWAVQGVRIIAANRIVDIEKSQIGADHLLYTAAGPNVYETWWQAGGGLKTVEIGSFD